MKKNKYQILTFGETDCDDCEICKGIAKAKKEGRELTMKEIKALFAKQDYINLIKKQGEYGN